MELRTYINFKLKYLKSGAPTDRSEDWDRVGWADLTSILTYSFIRYNYKNNLRLFLLITIIILTKIV